jgi:hypothetical protein
MASTFSTLKKRRIGIIVDYDSAVDVLRVVAKRFSHTEGMGLDRGIELDFDADTDTPSGATIIGYHKNRWDKNIVELAQILAKHVLLDQNVLVEAIIEKVGESHD